jgi:hypothetical protein
MLRERQILLGSGGYDIAGLAGRVGALLLNDLVECVGDSHQLAGSICRALKGGLLSLEFNEELLVVTDAGLRAAGLWELGPCRVRRYNVLEMVEGARLAMELERLGYPVYGPRELRALRCAGHALPCPVLRQSRDLAYTCEPGHLLMFEGSSDTRPISLQLAAQRGRSLLRLREVALALHRCDQLAGVIYYVPEIMSSTLVRLLGGVGLGDQALLSPDSGCAVEAVMSGARLVIVPESPQTAARRQQVSTLARDFTKHETVNISYQAAVRAVEHLLTEVNVLLDPEAGRELIERVLARPLGGQPAPFRDGDTQISYRQTVTALAGELRRHRADTCGASYEHTAERILERPLWESIEQDKQNEGPILERTPTPLVDHRGACIESPLGECRDTPNEPVGDRPPPAMDGSRGCPLRSQGRQCR